MAGWNPRFEAVRRLIGRDDCTIFDVGANIGDMIELYRVMFPRSTVHAFEPQPEIFAALGQRFDGAAGIVLNRLALGERAGDAVLYQNSRTDTSSLLPLYPDSTWVKSMGLRQSAEITVPVDTIDNYCARRGVATIDFLKLDIQGFEPECLRGALAMLGRQAIRVIQVEIITHRKYRRRTTFLDIESVLVPNGYRLYCALDLVGDPHGELLFLDAVYVREAEFP